jgi:hypothetical protein
VAWGIGLARLSDNSFFTHLATGRLILDTGHIPTVDPYSFTVRGEPWVVQSWLASLLYGVTEDVFGGDGLRVLTGLLVVGITAVAWRLARPARSFVVRLGIGALVLGVGSGLWAERPLLIGLLALGLTILAAEGGLDPRWLVPIGWIWVNSHGSFPLGVVYLLVVLVGCRLDGTPAMVERRAFTWLTGGILLGAINPLGPRLLIFPFELLQKRELLSYVSEWQAPTFLSLGQRLFLVQLAVVIVALVRRPSYRSGLVVCVFTLAALLGARNLTEASLDFGSLRCDLRGPLASGLAAMGLALAALLGSTRLSEPAFDFRGYPVEAVQHLVDHDVDLHEVRMAQPDLAGNFLELRFGDEANVFFDDRFDLFPKEVSDAHVALLNGSADADEALDTFDVDLVLLRRGDAYSQTLDASPDWRRLTSEKAWLLFCRRGADLGPEHEGC